ncbi:hypothetical protein, conserved in T. vivax [Trypanosoma vivax Y486]|uniref:Uncharacterized protein n=1 Tax=Trypanosoma vivax (strain Y486) TaxID=1055687 RepID=F9WVI3_TRYVY|nr:hypothetical protein, conserved in T. vivax [Trypanosoma vivax Y486]|eukprot:CCD21591.1 hypothetical protein, conserved in T. vivax [Trypanosoma vivax Y486]
MFCRPTDAVHQHLHILVRSDSSTWNTLINTSLVPRCSVCHPISVAAESQPDGFAQQSVLWKLLLRNDNLRCRYELNCPRACATCAIYDVVHLPPCMCLSTSSHCS